MRVVTVSLGLVLALASTAASAMNLVQNGGFDQTSNLTYNGATGAGRGQLGVTVVATGWDTTVSSPSGYLNQGYNFLFQPGTADNNGYSNAIFGAGGNFALSGPNNGIDNGLTGSTGGGNFIGGDGALVDNDRPLVVGPIYQTIGGLNPGYIYHLTFEWGAAQQAGFTGDTTAGWQVSFGNQIVTTGQIANPSKGFQPWRAQSFDFTAHSTSQVLSFLALGTPSGLPPFALLDTVELNDTGIVATPEPAGIALIGLGVLGIAAARRRNHA